MNIGKKRHLGMKPAPLANTWVVALSRGKSNKSRPLNKPRLRPINWEAKSRISPARIDFLVEAAGGGDVNATRTLLMHFVRCVCRGDDVPNGVVSFTAMALREFFEGRESLESAFRLVPT